MVNPWLIVLLRQVEQAYFNFAWHISSLKIVLVGCNIMPLKWPSQKWSCYSEEQPLFERQLCQAKFCGYGALVQVCCGSLRWVFMSVFGQLRGCNIWWSPSSTLVYFFLKDGITQLHGTRDYKRTLRNGKKPSCLDFVNRLMHLETCVLCNHRNEMVLNIMKSTFLEQKKSVGLHPKLTLLE